VIISLQEDEHSVSIGSGFFVTKDGILVTNAHILEDAERILVYVENQAVFANPRVLFVDPDADLAALQLQSAEVTALQFAQHAPDEATQVIAVGYPRLIDVLNMGFALHSTITPGTINGHVNGRTRIEGRHATFLQITGTLNAGNSGGPLVDMESGDVVGMVTQTVPYLERAKDKNGAVVASVTIRSGIGYAIPATRIRQWLVEHRLLSLDQLSRAAAPVAIASSNEDPAWLQTKVLQPRTSCVP
jgi:S1-C subfamily serine protease